jgi:hypothetical protein
MVPIANGADCEQHGLLSRPFFCAVENDVPTAEPRFPECSARQAADDIPNSVREMPASLARISARIACPHRLVPSARG